MKKDLIFAPILLAVGIALGMLKLTGMPVHIVLSVVGVAVLAAYTVLAKKSWKIPALEIAMRASYAVALITGILLKIVYVVALGVAHKIFAAAFIVLLIVVVVHKVVKSKK